MLRAIKIVTRKIKLHQDEFPTLYREVYQVKETKGYAIWKNSLISLLPEAHKEYQLLIEKYFQLTEFPDINRRIMVTTSLGNRFPAFYEDGQWKYRTIVDVVRLVEDPVISWEFSRTMPKVNVN